MMRTIREIISRSIQSVSHSAQQEISRRISYEVRKAQRRFLKSMISFFLMAFAFVLLTLGCVYLSVEYLAFTKTLGLLTAGIFILLIGIILKIID